MSPPFSPSWALSPDLPRPPSPQALLCGVFSVDAACKRAARCLTGDSLPRALASPDAAPGGGGRDSGTGEREGVQVPLPWIEALPLPGVSF